MKNSYLQRTFDYDENTKKIEKDSKRQEYLRLFGETFKNKIEILIKRQVDKQNSIHLSPLFNEILHHSKHAERLYNKMNFIKNEYLDIEKYILNNNNRPFIVTGHSGAGKSWYFNIFELDSTSDRHIRLL